MVAMSGYKGGKILGRAIAASAESKLHKKARAVAPWLMHLLSSYNNTLEALTDQRMDLFLTPTRKNYLSRVGHLTTAEAEVPTRAL